MQPTVFGSPAKVAKMAGRDHNEIRRLAKAGELPCEYVGTHMKIPIEAAMDILIDRAMKNMLNKPSQTLPQEGLTEEKKRIMAKLMS